MKFLKKTFLPIFLAGIIVSIIEFLRNQFLYVSNWTEHYSNLGIIFPLAPANGAIWGVWSVCFAVAVFILSKKFSLWGTTLLAWFMGFVLMWIVIGNMNVLPFEILWGAVPMSFIETFLAAYLIKKFS